MHVELFLSDPTTSPKGADLPIITSLKCLVDGHHDFMTTFSLTEIWDTRPIWGQNQHFKTTTALIYGLFILKENNHPALCFA